MFFYNYAQKSSTTYPKILHSILDLLLEYKKFKTENRKFHTRTMCKHMVGPVYWNQGKI